jgi:phosphatidylserine decarboxylase
VEPFIGAPPRDAASYRGVYDTSVAAPLTLRLLGLYPKKLGSSVVGFGARARIPRALRRRVVGGFAARFGADISEAEKPLEEYGSLLDFFTRRLKPGLRPQAPPAPGALSSPVDGALLTCGVAEAGTLMQVKGLPYRVDELLPGEPLLPAFVQARYATLYLAPKDYHRIHVPLEGNAVAVGRVEGELWPVNDVSTRHTPRLYVRNRRAYWIAEGAGRCSGLTVAVVMVAATHVGGVVVDPRWLPTGPLGRRERRALPGLACAPGDDLGTFELGSTVVVLVGGARAAEWRCTREPGAIRLGERLGAFG